MDTERITSSSPKRIVRIATFVSAIALTLTWLCLFETSPVHEWVLEHPLASNLAMAANLPAYLLAVLCSGNVHAPGNAWIAAAIVAQWCLVGLVAAWAWCRLRPVRAGIA